MQTLRPLQRSDVDAVVALIDSHDEDDAEEAREGFGQTDGLDDYFVLEHDDQVIGICGYRTPPACDRTHWLSWTYIHADHVNQGHGRRMIEELLQHLRSIDARKLFIKVSDYSETLEDGSTEEPYAAALHLYQKLGFAIELKHADYYDEGEALIILGRRLDAVDADSKTDDGQADADQEDADFSDISLSELGNGPLLQSRPVQFDSVHEIVETDGAWSFGWHDDGKRLFTSEDVQVGLEEVKKRQGRAVFLSFPSDYQGIDERLYAAGFHNSGALDDYFENGVHERHFTYHFTRDLLLGHD